MKMSKKLLIVMGSMGRGGAEKVISHISECFAEKGWKVSIALLLFNRVDYKLHENVEIIDLTGDTESRKKRAFYWINGIRSLVKRINPDCVLSFAARVNVITLLACLGKKTKVVVSERNDPYCDGRSKGVDMLTNWLYPKASSVVFQTRRAATYFDKLKLTNSAIIPNPVSVQCVAEKPKKGKIVTAGRLTPQKNQKMLITAFAEAVKEYPYTYLEIFGDGELKEELSALAETLGVGEKVIFKGNVLDLHRQISDSAAFVLSSDYEGLSNALLEAMMMGLPCISTDCAGSDEYIVDGENGLLVPVGDEKAMATALKRILGDEETAACYGAAAMDSTKHLSKELLMSEWTKVIE